MKVFIKGSSWAFISMLFFFQMIAGSHDSERPAWGGNGGWWGDSHNDWYGEYGTPEERRQEETPSPSPSSKEYHPNTYNYNNEYPRAGEKEPVNGEEADTVDGAAIYIDK